MTKSNEYIDPRRQDLAADPHWPLYHFLAPANYMGDPNGMIFWGVGVSTIYSINIILMALTISLVACIGGTPSVKT